MKLDNKVAIVTASTKGIGLASSLILAQNGATVYLAARNKELADGIINEHKNLKLKFVHFDARNDETMKNMVDEVFKKEGHVDILVNNFGGNDPQRDKTIFDTDPKDYMEMVESNLKSVFITSQAACNKMKETGGGSIINISTVGSVIPDISRIAYVTSKAAINSLTQNIAVHGGRYNIRCNAVLPGLTATNAVKENMPQEFVDVFLASTLINRPGTPEDIANAVLYFASDDSAYVTGQILSVSGGFGQATPVYSAFTKKK